MSKIEENYDNSRLLAIKRKTKKELEVKRKEALKEKNRYKFPYHNCPKCGSENIKLTQEYWGVEFYEYALNKSKTINLNPKVTQDFPSSQPMALKCNDCHYRLSAGQWGEKGLSELENNICEELEKADIWVSKYCKKGSVSL